MGLILIGKLFISKFEFVIVINHHGPHAIPFEPIMGLIGRYHYFTFALIALATHLNLCLKVSNNSQP